MITNRYMALFVVLGYLMQGSLSAETIPKARLSTATADSLREWPKLKYGMFIHFGMSTFSGNEHQREAVPSNTYAPTNLDVEQWVRVARDAGMKYVVLTAKHSAGHCLWDSRARWKGKEFDYDVATSGDKTDVVAALVAACKKYDVKPGLYYCLEDYRNNANYHVPKPRRNSYNLPAEYHQLVKDHVEELLRRYPDVFYLWLDIPVQAGLKQRTNIYKHIKTLKPGCLVLYNTGMAQHKRTIQNIHKAAWPKDILNTEIHLPQRGSIDMRQSYRGKTYDFGYEHCDKIGKWWFWMPDEKPRPTEELFRIYQEVQQLGGNLLLNVPPDKTGRISQQHIDALMDLRKKIDL